MNTSFWFKSSEIKIEVGEDEETNPMRYGKGLAKWLTESLQSQGYETEFGPEDWGWRVNCLTEPCPIWLGIGNVDQIDENGEFIKPDESNIVWHCFIEADIPFFSKLFKKINPANEIEKVGRDLASLLRNTQHIQLVEEP